MAEHDHLDGGGFDAEPPHVAGHGVGCHAGVEHNVRLLLALVHSHEHGEPVLGLECVNCLALLEERFG